MTEQDFIESLRPGEWICDNSRHIYNVKGKPTISFRWDCRDKAGNLHFGYGSYLAEAEAEARGVAKTNNPQTREK